MSFFIQWLVSAIAAAVAVWLVPGMVPVGDQLTSILVFALCIALVNASIRPLLEMLSFPLTVITLGLFHFIVNAIALNIASWLCLNLTHVGVYIESFWAALIGSIIISIVSGVVGSIIGD